MSRNEPRRWLPGFESPNGIIKVTAFDAKEMHKKMISLDPWSANTSVEAELSIEFYPEGNVIKGLLAKLIIEGTVHEPRYKFRVNVALSPDLGDFGEYDFDRQYKIQLADMLKSFGHLDIDVHLEARGSLFSDFSLTDPGGGKHLISLSGGTFDSMGLGTKGYIMLHSAEERRCDAGLEDFQKNLESFMRAAADFLSALYQVAGIPPEINERQVILALDKFRYY